MTNRLWILGASDPEMAAIEKLLTKAGESFTYATCGGDRVHPGNAYRADHPQAGVTHFVECQPETGYQEDAVIIDHHRPGDPGYGLPPAQYWAASSIGQVWSVLFPCGENHGDGNNYSQHWDCPRCGQNPEYWDVAKPLLLTAAADHCLGAAYRGECPGVDPEALAEWRAESRAKFQGVSVADILVDIESAKEKIRAKQQDGFADMTGEFIPELPEAACQLGIAVLAGPLDCPDGRKKIVLQAASPQQIQSFLDGEVAPDLVDKYGDPARGFAGGYLKA